jgi:ABC-type antimicrobial peptide transport system permease subunit
MFTIFGAIALVLALTGVYGLISYGVAQRTHEIGVRMALGARSEDVLRMVIGQGAKLAGIGIGIGLLGAWGAGTALQSVLWQAPAADPISFSVIVTLLTGTAVIASWLPARRAAAVDPMVALREE